MTIICYVALAAVILVAIYFQYKTTTLDSRVREAETVARKFEDVLKATTSVGDLKNNYTTVLRRTTDTNERVEEIEEQMKEQIELLMENIEILSEENTDLHVAYNGLVSSITGKIEGLPDNLMLKEKDRRRVNLSQRGFDRSRDRDGWDEEEYEPAYRGDNRSNRSRQVSRDDERSRSEGRSRIVVDRADRMDRVVDRNVDRGVDRGVDRVNRRADDREYEPEARSSGRTRGRLQTVDRNGERDYEPRSRNVEYEPRSRERDDEYEPRSRNGSRGVDRNVEKDRAYSRGGQSKADLKESREGREDDEDFMA